MPVDDQGPSDRDKATATDIPAASRTPVDGARARNVLLVDLNNFASFPTLAIGLLVARLRSTGHHVRVLSPLSHDVPATLRERREGFVDHLLRRIHLSDWAPFLAMRDRLRAARLHSREKAHPATLREVRRALADRPDAVLLSAYLQHFDSVREIGRLAAEHGIPVLVGGPMFNVRQVAQSWAGLRGVTAIVGAEVDQDLPALLDALCAGGDLLRFPGVSLPDGSFSRPARPLRPLTAVPIPDFQDFPWQRYPVRIVPVMTGRGCQWDNCLFCSDVISASGRTFRTRTIDSVLEEIREQAQRHDTSNFLFLDLKLNSNPDMFRGLAKGIRRHVPGAEWIGTVHVDQRKDSGLSRKDLFQAAEGGMRRISFGLESGSQRLLDLMKKGSSVELNSRFLRDAFDAGISIRCTMFKGYPGETAADMDATADFLEQHAAYLDRVRFNDFSVPLDTPIYHQIVENGGRLGSMELGAIISERARVDYRNASGTDRAYRKAKARALATVSVINRRRLRDAARQFDGLM